MNFPKNSAIYVGGLVIALLFVFLCVSGFFARRHAISQCGMGMDCTCFKNVVNNRLSKAEVRAFNEFLKAVRLRPTANILEFTDEQSAQVISASIGICRTAQVASNVKTTDPKTTTNKKKDK